MAERGCTVLRPLQKAQAFGLLVISEDESSKTLLVHEIVAKEDYYMRSGEHVQRWSCGCLLVMQGWGSGGGAC